MEAQVRKAFWVLSTAGLMAAAACGKVDKAGEPAATGAPAATPAAAPAAPAAEPAFNAALCLPALDSKKGANATVPPGGCVISPNKAYALVMTNAGELKVAAVENGALGQTVWSTGSHATSPGSASTAFQEDANLVIYDQPGNKPIWSSASVGPLEAYHLVLTDAGELQTTRVGTGKVTWSSKTGAVADALK